MLADNETGVYICSSCAVNCTQDTALHIPANATTSNKLSVGINTNDLALYQLLQSLQQASMQFANVWPPGTVRLCYGDSYSVDTAARVLQVPADDVAQGRVCMDRVLRLYVRTLLHSTNALTSSVIDLWDTDNELNPQVALMSGLAMGMAIRLRKYVLGENSGSVLDGCALDSTNAAPFDVENFNRYAHARLTALGPRLTCRACHVFPFVLKIMLRNISEQVCCSVSLIYIFLPYLPIAHFL